MNTRTRRADVADQLLHGIRSGAYPPGERLPSERRLSESFGVSRPVVREALGMLSSLGLVEVQVGRGAFVTEKEISEQSRAAERSLADITLAREAIETGAIAMADVREADVEAQNLVEAALAELARCVEAGMQTTEADDRLHRAIVGTAGSQTILHQWEQLTREISAVVRVSPDGGAMNAATLEAHRVLAAGVLGGDRDSALRICHELHEDYRQLLRRLLG